MAETHHRWIVLETLAPYPKGLDYRILLTLLMERGSGIMRMAEVRRLLNFLQAKGYVTLIETDLEKLDTELEIARITPAGRAIVARQKIDDDIAAPKT